MTEPDNLEEPAAPIRVLITNLSGDLANLLTALVQTQHDMVLLKPVHGTVEVLVAAKDADVLILGAPHVLPPPAVCSHLLSEYPDLRIVVVTPDGDESMVYWRGLQRQWLDSRSSTAIIGNIRQSYRLNATI